MKLKIVAASLATFLACAVFAKSLSQKKQTNDGSGLFVEQLRNLVDILPPLPGTIQAIQFLQNGGFHINRAAVLTDGTGSGWQIFVFHMGSTGKFDLEWRSGKLDDSFAVSSADQFQADSLFDEQVLNFSGCAAHACPDVFSAMLYVPSKKTAFTATYIRGKVTYSPSISGPMFRYYKMDLDHAIAEHRNPISPR